MPNNITPRYDVAEMCNPTHSTAVNKLRLKAVIKKEAARVGHPSQARRVFQSSKYVRRPSLCCRNALSRKLAYGWMHTSASSII